MVFYGCPRLLHHSWTVHLNILVSERILTGTTSFLSNPITSVTYSVSATYSKTFCPSSYFPPEKIITWQFIYKYTCGVYFWFVLVGRSDVTKWPKVSQINTTTTICKYNRYPLTTTATWIYYWYPLRQLSRLIISYFYALYLCMHNTPWTCIIHKLAPYQMNYAAAFSTFCTMVQTIKYHTWCSLSTKVSARPCNL